MLTPADHRKYETLPRTGMTEEQRAWLDWYLKMEKYEADDIDFACNADDADEGDEEE